MNTLNFNFCELVDLLIFFKNVFMLTDRCLGKVDNSFCGSNIPRWYYNSVTEKCENFTYGGCFPNGNNFKSWTECATLCEGYKEQTTNTLLEITTQPMKTNRLPEKCFLNKERGPCDDYKLRFYFDSLHRKCRPFMFSGCEANENNFNSQEECYDACPGQSPNLILHSRGY